MKTHLVAVLAAVALLVFCAACGAGHDAALGGAVPPNPPAGPAETAEGFPQLGAPAALLKRVEALGDDNRLIGYDDAGARLDSNLASVSGAALSFSPDWDPQMNPQPDQLAYAIFAFGDLATHSGPARIVAGYPDGLPQPGRVWFGLGNLVRNTWDWFPANPAGGTTFSGFADYVSPGGEMLCTVLVTGSQEVRLGWLLAGANSAPKLQVLTNLNPSPPLNVAPFELQVQASAEAYGGSISGFDFDWDADGTFDLSADADGIASHVYAPGSYSLLVRCKDNSGLQDLQQKDFIIVDPGNQPPVADLSTNVLSGEAPLAIELDASGSSDDGQIVEYRWDLDSDGQIDQTTTLPFLSTVLSARGTATVTVEVVDNDTASSMDSVDIELLSGWEASEFNAAPGVTELEVSSAGLFQGSRPVVVWKDGPAAYFSRAAEDSSGAQWEAPVYIQPTEQGNSAGLAVAWNPLTSAPAIAYINYNLGVHALRYVQASDSSLSSWSAPVTVDTGIELYDRHALSFVAGKPVLAVIPRPGGDSTHELWHYIAADGNGANWGNPKVQDTGDLIGLQAIRLLNTTGGVFTAVAGRKQGAGYFARLYRAESNTLDNWSSPLWEINRQTNAFALLTSSSKLSLCAISRSVGDKLYFDRSADSGGELWNGGQELVVSSDAAMATVDGRPWIVYHSQEPAGLFLLRALDSEGTAWAEPEALRFTDSSSLLPRIVVCAGNAHIAYYDEAAQKILTLRWLPAS